MHNVGFLVERYVPSFLQAGKEQARVRLVVVDFHQNLLKHRRASKPVLVCRPLAAHNQLSCSRDLTSRSFWPMRDSWVSTDCWTLPNPICGSECSCSEERKAHSYLDQRHEYRNP